MADGSKTVIAACLCGAQKEELSLPASTLPLQSWFCHCDSCRSLSGALCSTIAELPAGCAPSQSIIDSLQTFKFSDQLDVLFCGTCGSQMFWRNPKPEGAYGAWDACTGVLEKADGILSVQGHFFVGDTLDGGCSDWLTSVAGKTVPRHLDNKGSETIPLGWRHQRSIHTRTEDLPSRYHAHCKCAGVSFYIARPNTRSVEATSPWPDVLIPWNSGPHNMSENETWWLRANKQRFLAGVCSCNSCRLGLGYEFGQWAFVPTVDISLDAEGKEPFRRDFGMLKRYASSKDCVRYFCGGCGAVVFYENHVRPALFDIAVGLIDAPEGARAESLLEWRCERLSFREDAEGRARSLVEGIEKGMLAYGEQVSGRTDMPEEAKEHVKQRD